MVKYDFLILDSLQKVFPEQKPEALSGPPVFSGFYGERISFQLAYYMEYEDCDLFLQEVEIRIVSDILHHVNMRRVELVPATLPAYHGQLDDTYLFTQPRLCPDLLLPMENQVIRPYAFQWRALWFDIEITEDMEDRAYPLSLTIIKEGAVMWEKTITIQSLGEALPPQKLIHTEWFHGDCLADYYKVPVFSQEHWDIMDHFVAAAVKFGCNMLLTPIFTPPLDTKKGGERSTIQLVGVTKCGNQYTFDFTLLVRWISMCRRRGIQYLEISHLFTQWGAEHAPKIIALENGSEKLLFGWKTAATGEAYQGFLKQFLPSLLELLKSEDILSNTYFHISDEPHGAGRVTYAAAKNSVKDLLAGCQIMDALSSYEFYEEGIVEHPIPCNNSIQEFLDGGVKDLWTYYCCVQGHKVSNRFMAMPSARNRIIGVQFYLYHIVGFLHWGFNFYNSQHSLGLINPYLVTDAAGGFPSGDPYVVYPAEDGTPYESIRLMVFAEALYDLRAFERLEQLTDRSFVEKIILEGLDYKITFEKYPADSEYLIALRRRVNDEIRKRQET